MSVLGRFGDVGGFGNGVRRLRSGRSANDDSSRHSDDHIERERDDGRARRGEIAIRFLLDAAAESSDNRSRLSENTVQLMMIPASTSAVEKEQG